MFHEQTRLRKIICSHVGKSVVWVRLLLMDGRSWLMHLLIFFISLCFVQIVIKIWRLDNIAANETRGNNICGWQFCDVYSRNFVLVSNLENVDCLIKSSTWTFNNTYIFYKICLLEVIRFEFMLFKFKPFLKKFFFFLDYSLIVLWINFQFFNQFHFNMQTLMDQANKYELCIGI